MKKQLRLTCHYCDERLVVDFYDMRKSENAHETLRRAGWIFGVEVNDGIPLFDPICHDCGRGVYRQMLAVGGGKIDPEAKKKIQALYPELFDDELKN